MNVLWARRARSRLRDIYVSIGKDSPARATSFCDWLIDAADRLAVHPLSGPVLPEDPAYRQLVLHDYRIVYRVSEETVYILTIVAPGMNYDQAIK